MNQKLRGMHESQKGEEIRLQVEFSNQNMYEDSLKGGSSPGVLCERSSRALSLR